MDMPVRTTPARRLGPTAALCLLALSLSCGSNKGTGDWELQAFDVPAGQRDQIRTVLGDLLAADRARVQLGPDGRLLVMAPRPLQRQIKEVLDGMHSRAFSTAAAVEVSYWMVLAQPRPPGAAPMPVPPALGSAVPEIERAVGPVDLRIVEKLQLRSAPGEDARAEGGSFDIRQTASVASGRVVGSFQVRATLREPNGGIGREDIFQSRVSLVPGQIAVIGQGGLPGVPVTLKGEVPDGSSLLVVVRASVLDAPDAR
jgi:hypothetical protein